MSNTVHPRLCGEHAGAGHNEAAEAGSSPPVRGTHFLPSFQAAIWRFIPACAGKHDQPHALGTHHGGSSPPVRGTQGGSEQPAPLGRFIPACAGNT